MDNNSILEVGQIYLSLLSGSKLSDISSEIVRSAKRHTEVTPKTIPAPVYTPSTVPCAAPSGCWTPCECCGDLPRYRRGVPKEFLELFGATLEEQEAEAKRLKDQWLEAWPDVARTCPACGGRNVTIPA